jgi:RNA polymerase sigma-B factor
MTAKSGEVEVALTEDFETMTAEPAGGQALADTEEVLAVAGLIAGELDEDGSEQLSGAIRIQHAVRDRGHARELFVLLAELPEGDSERLRIRGELVELHLPLVEYLARRFRNRGEWLDDLTQVATIGLIKSIDRFDLSRGVEFSTYATPTIVGEIKRHFRDKGWAVRVPRRLQELKLALTKAIGDLAQRLGRAPTVAELAAHLQMSEEDVLEGLESANAYSTVSLDAPDSGDEDAPAVAESLGMVDEALEGVEYRESLKPLLERLPPREKRILLFRRGSRLLGGEGQRSEAGRNQQQREPGDGQRDRRAAQPVALALHQVDADDAGEQLGQQRGRPAPAPDLQQAERRQREQDGGSSADRRQRDPARVLVGLPLAGRDAGEHRGGQHAGGLDRLHGGGQQDGQRTPLRASILTGASLSACAPC